MNKAASAAGGEHSTSIDVDFHGSIVAFEGSGDVISTQLRLLPASPQILILPGVQQYCANDGLDVPDKAFDPTTFIRTVHDAVVARNETATAFLREGSLDSKRLVFLNGGTPSAQALCVRAIARHETDGDVEAAEALFHDMVKDGLAGLSSYKKALESPDTVCPYVENEDDYKDYDEDPITKAMRAADMLDRQTAGLQPNTDLDYTIKPRPRSMTLPLYGFSDQFGESAPFYVFGVKPQQAAKEDEDDDDDDYGKTFLADPKTPTVEVNHFRDVDYEASLTRADDLSAVTSQAPPTPRSPSCIGESYSRRPSNVSIAPEEYQSTLFTPFLLEKVVYGEASVVRMGRPLSTNLTRPKRTRSLDRGFPISSQYQDVSLRTRLEDKDNSVSSKVMIRRFSCMDAAREQPASPSRPRFHSVVCPKTIFVKPRRMGSSLKPQEKLRPVSYVDRGTDTEDLLAKDEQFLAVLPFDEHLVVYFKEPSAEDVLLKRILQSYKDGLYPIAMQPQEPELDRTPTPGCSGSRSSSVSLGEVHEHEMPQEETTPVEVKHESDDEYDPFAYAQATWEPAKPMTVTAPSIVPPVPPTPAQTPPPGLQEIEEKFHDFDTSSCHTAVVMQNSLRSILDIYFPPETNGFHQFNFPCLSELDGFWKPIFRETEPGSAKHGRPKVDQILAIGAQEDVKKEYLSAITGQLEKLGGKPNGISRSGRLDFRYLIANAMQAFTAQPLAKQRGNPFADSYILATLLIPHLETYLAAHSGIRFLLLEYPPDHLATVLALQNLVGLDFMKVAQIVDSNAKEPLPFNHIRGDTISPWGADKTLKSQSSNLTQQRPLSPSPALPGESLSYTKANFLLTSSATDAEIANFISTIWNILREISPFYLPEEKPETKPSTPKLKVATQKTFSPFPKASKSRPQSPLSPPPSATRFSSVVARPPSPGATSIKAPSIAETIKTIKSYRSRKAAGAPMPPPKEGRPRPLDAESVLTLDLEYDSDFEDLEEKRLMPIFMKKPEIRKGNSHKALKFLGLA